MNATYMITSACYFLLGKIPWVNNHIYLLQKKKSYILWGGKMTKYHSNKKSTWKHDNKLIYLVCLAAKSGTFGVEILQHMYHWVDVTLPMEDDIKLFRRKETNFVKEFGVHVWLFWYEFESILYTLIIHWSILVHLLFEYASVMILWTLQAWFL
jgi:hypothetical protein